MTQREGDVSLRLHRETSTKFSAFPATRTRRRSRPPFVSSRSSITQIGTRNRVRRSASKKSPKLTPCCLTPKSVCNTIARDSRGWQASRLRIFSAESTSKISWAVWTSDLAAVCLTGFFDVVPLGHHEAPILKSSSRCRWRRWRVAEAKRSTIQMRSRVPTAKVPAQRQGPRRGNARHAKEQGTK